MLIFIFIQFSKCLEEEENMPLMDFALSVTNIGTHCEFAGSYLCYLSSSGVGRCQKVCVCVCVDTYTYIYVPSVKNQFKRDVIECVVIYVMVIEIFHKIINRYMKDAK